MLLFYCRDSAFGPYSEGADQLQAIAWGGLREFVSKRDFWLIAVAVMAAGFVDQAFMQHQVLYLRIDMGMTATYVAGVISVFGAIGIIGRIVVGGIFDAKSVKGVSACNGACPWSIWAHRIL